MSNEQAKPTPMTGLFDPNIVLPIIQSDATFGDRAVDWNAVIRFDMESMVVDATVENGQLISLAPSAALPSITIKGPAQGWKRVLQACPPPHYQDIWVGAAKIGFTLSTPDMLAFLAYYPAITRMIEIMRESVNGHVDGARHPYPFRATDNAVGRYVYVEIDGVEYRVYFEEAGKGVPLVLHHTAGADSRQWRHLLADPDLQSRYRMIAYDLPFHGRSLPPDDGTPWWNEKYRPTKAWLMSAAVAIMAAVGAERPIFMGCSVGGQLATDLAAHHGEALRGCVAINAYFHQDGLHSNTTMKQDIYDHPRTSHNAMAARMVGCTSPCAPEAFRRENYWIYASQTPGIYKGDNDYFLFQHDLRDDGHLIDAQKTPVYVLAGEYDGSTIFPSGGAAIAEHIDGVRYHVMPGMGHFAPSEDPVEFRKHVIPVLDAIVRRTS